MLKIRHLQLSLYLVIFLAVFAQNACAGSPLCLIIEDEGGKTLFKWPVRNGSQFAIRFNHSVALSPVTDYYKIENGKIFLDKTVYQDFGAGLPHAPEAGQKMTTGNGEIVISGFDRELPAFEVRVGRIARHRLLLFDREVSESKNDINEIPFTELAKPGSALRFSLSGSCAP